MEGELADTSMDLSNQIPVTIEDFSSQRFSESLIEPTLYGVNTHNQFFSGFPFPLMSQEDPPFRDLHSNLSLTHLSHLDNPVHHGRDPFFGDNASSHQLVSQHLLCSSFNNSASSFPHKVADSWQAFPCGGYSQALSSSVETPLQYAYKGQVSDPHEKWNFSKLLNQPEFSWKEATLTSPFYENMDSNRWIQGSSGPPSSEPNNEHLPPPVGLRIQENCPDMSCSDQHPCQGNGVEVCLSSGSNGDSSSRFSQVISQSKYLRVLQEVLSEFSSFSLENMEEVGAGSTSSPPSLVVSGGASNKPAFYSHQHRLTDQGMTSFMGFTELLSSSLEGSSDVPPAEPLSEVKDGKATRAQLLGLLQMVDDCYNQCLDEIHTVISAFHAATELDTQIHACFALRTISICYKSLKERISNKILRMGIDVGGASSSKSQRQSKDSFEKFFLQKQWALHQLRRRDQLWRPQRGLPERSVSVLRAWMFQNFLHPYPKDAEKHLLAIKSGLTRSQVSNWFINARVRLWKPLIEEMYSELNRRKGREGNTRNLSCSSLICNQTFNTN